MKMKENVLKILLGAILIIGVLATSSFAAPKNTAETAVTEEQVQSMIQESVNSAMQNAVEQMKAQNEANKTENTEKESSNGVGLIAAAIATGLACIGSGIAVAVVASSAVGAISENPSLLGKTIIFAGLAEGIAIYGLIISIMILNQV